MNTVKPTPAFTRTAASISSDVRLVPLVEQYVRSARFPKEFSVTYRDEGKERVPDGFFHPSTHPMWTERQLYYYLSADPKDLIPEDYDYGIRTAMIMGTGLHKFIQACLLDAGLLIPPTGTCPACGKTHGSRKGQCDEWGVIDPVLGRKGHIDGVLEIPDWGRGLFEFKSIGERGSFGISHNNLEWLKTKKAMYYYQIQDYLDITGHQKALIVFGRLGMPWQLFEIEVPYDPEAVMELRKKYGNVREAVALNVLPDPCCSIKSAQSRQCFAREVCPVGRLR